MVRAEGGALAQAATRELVQSFGLEAFAHQGVALDGYADIIRSLETQVGKGVRRVGVTLGRDLCLIRKVPLTLGLNQEMADAHLRWEAEQGLVSPLSTYVLDHQRLPVTSHAGHPIYLLVLLRKTVLRQLQRLFDGLGLNLIDLDVDVFAMIRTFLATQGAEADNLSVLVDIEAHRMTVIVIREGDYFLMHRIALDQAGLQRKAQRLEEQASVLVKELRRLVFGHRLGSDLEALDRIILTGEGASHDWVDLVSAQVSVPVELYDPLSRIKLSGSVTQNPEISRTARFYGAAVGVALKQNAILTQ